ncbi:MAG: hypothetical protein QOF53_2380 [Nocardioidaceae bacterium]|nr:hypothetical protein [Nocardioidaceae bacterium]
MSSVGSFLDLTEPAYVLLGGLLPQDDPNEVELLVSPTSIVTFDAQAGPVLEYFSVPRTRSEALADIREWHGTPEDLDSLVADGTLVALPSGDQSQLISVLEGLTVRVTAPARMSPTGRSVLLLVADERAIDIDVHTASVLASPQVRSLGLGVEAVSQESGMALDRVWRLVLHDLSAILQTRAGHLALAEAPA